MEKNTHKVQGIFVCVLTRLYPCKNDRALAIASSFCDSISDMSICGKSVKFRSTFCRS